MADHSGSGSDPARARSEELSALLDGELQGDAVERICSEWRTDAHSRDTWHAYNLIGDVLRCEDLSRSCASDEQFLRDFRKRMGRGASGPRTATCGLSCSGFRKRHAFNPCSVGARMGVACGLGGRLCVVVGVVVGVQNPAVTTDVGPLVAAAPAGNASDAMLQVSQTEEVAPPADVYPAGMELVFDGQVIRDPRLDRYLLAHKQFAGNSVLGRHRACCAMRLLKFLSGDPLNSNAVDRRRAQIASAVSKLMVPLMLLLSVGQLYAAPGWPSSQRKSGNGLRGSTTRQISGISGAPSSSAHRVQ